MTRRRGDAAIAAEWPAARSVSRSRSRGSSGPRRVLRPSMRLLPLLVCWLSALATCGGVAAAAPMTWPKSRECAFFETPVAQEYVARLATYDDLLAQERVVSELVSPAVAEFSMEIMGRSPFASQIPTDFVVMKLFSCELGAQASSETASGSGDSSDSICHPSESVLGGIIDRDDAMKTRVKAFNVNRAYRKVQLFASSSGSDEADLELNDTIATDSPKSLTLKNMFGLRKQPTLLVDDLGIRDLWERGFKGQGVRVGVFDTGLSSPRVENVKERINWTHEKKNDDSAGHGTFVASVVGGSDENCPGLAPEADLFVFRMFTDDQLSFTSWYLDAFNYALFKKINVLNLSTGGPDFQDLPFVEKVQELTANGIILVSAVGNNGPRYGMLSNPADQMEVIGVGGMTVDDEVADFSSRGMTTWEFPFGSGRVKPDIVTLAQDISGSGVGKGCKMLSGTSASAPIVSASIAVLASIVPEEDRWRVLNPASMKQVLLQSAEQLEPWRETKAHVVHNHIFEQGAGKMNVTRASELVLEMWDTYQARRDAMANNDSTVVVGKPSSFPDHIDTTQCPYLWPLCSQPLFHSSLPLMVNLTIMNPASVSGKLLTPPRWVPAANGEHLTVSVASPDTLWPYYGSLGVFVEVKEEASQFNGIAAGSLVIDIQNGPHIDEVVVPVRVNVIPTPPKAKRILWDQFRNIPYPSAFVPRDSLEHTTELLDSAGDHPHTNFHQLWNFLIDQGFFIEILPFELSCVKLEQYGVVMMIDPEEEFFDEEITAIRDAIKYSNVSLVILADWFDAQAINAMEMFDTSTLSHWHAITGGANIPALNKLLREFHITFGDGAISNSSVDLLSPADSDGYPYWSGSFLTEFPVGGYLGFIDAIDQIALTMNGSEREVRDMAVLGLYQVPATNGGRIAVFGDSSCVDASAHPSSNFRNCFSMIEALLHFTNEGVLPPELEPDEGTSGLRVLERDYHVDDMTSTVVPGADGSDVVFSPVQLDDIRRREFAKYSKVVRAMETQPVRQSFCRFYRREECTEQHQVTLQVTS